jgi:diamine N-acetyltransferase
MNVIYRPASSTDAAIIAALGATVWITTYAREGVVPVFAEYVLEHFTEQRVRAAILEPDTRYWVAEASGGILGFVEFRRGVRTHCLSDLRQAEVSRLYVLERFTRHGIGRGLLDRCREDAKSFGASAMWLSVYSENARAMDFYRSSGWRLAGETGFLLGGVNYLNYVFSQDIKQNNTAESGATDNPGDAQRLREDH